MQGALWVPNSGAFSAATHLSVAGNVAGLFCSVSVFRSLVDYKLQDVILFFIYQYITADDVP
jgi:hypothetical protein